MTHEPRTLSQWLTYIPQDIVEAVLVNVTAQDLAKKYYSYTSAVLLSFDWGKSKQGPTFWVKVYKELNFLAKQYDRYGQLNMMNITT